MKKAFLTLSSMFVVFLFSASGVYADTFVIQPGPEDGQDTGFNGGSANYSDSGSVPIGGWFDVYHDLFKFNLDDAPVAASTVSAKLRVWGVRPGDAVGGNDPGLQMHRVTSVWDEATASWTNNPSAVFYKTMPVTLPSNNTYGWVETDITDLYKAWKNGTYPNHGVKLIPTNVNHSNGEIFASENLDIVHRPKITVTTNITEVNQPPVLNPIGNKTVVVGQLLQFSVTATDPDEGQSVTLLASSIPAGSTFNPQTGLFSWTPTAFDIGTDSVEFVATDTGHPSVDDSETITITVTAVPDVTPPVAAPAQLFTANGDIVVNWNWSEEVGGSGINSSNCAMSDTSLNEEDVTLNATCADITGNIGSVSYVVRVNITEIRPGPEDGQDTSHSSAATTPDSETLNSGGWFNSYIDLFKFNLGTAPAADDTVAVEFWFWGSRPSDSVGGNDPALNMYRITSDWSEAVEGGNDPSAVFYKTLPVMMPSDGTHDWVKTDITDLYKTWRDGTYPNYGLKLIPGNVNHSNGDIFASENRDIAHRPKFVIQHVLAPTNQSPILDSIGAQTAFEGQTLQFTVSASDPDEEDVVTLSANNLPEGASFDSETGVFSWTLDFDDAGLYSGIEFVATDNADPMASTSETITITVNDLNRAPVLETIGDKSVNEGALLQFTLSATDQDTNDVLTFSANNLPLGATFNPATRTFSWTPSFTQEGNYENIEFTVTDNGSPIELDLELITITVGNVNRAPIVDSIAPQEVLEGGTTSFTVTASDPDLDTVTLAATNLPTGASFNAQSGAFSWTSTLSQSGVYIVTFTATDNGSPVEIGTTDVVITVGDNPTPTEQIETIIETVITYNFPTNVENSYMANLKKVEKFIEEGKIGPAIAQLNAFMTKVENHYANNIITLEVRNTLITYAQNLLADLQ